MVHFGQAEAVLAGRQAVLDTAYQAHPDRFVRRLPKPLPLPSEVWINRPVETGLKSEEKVMPGVSKGLTRAAPNQMHKLLGGLR
jgi:hypothetical protein